MKTNEERFWAGSDQRGFTMAELMVAMMVFTVILGSVVLLLTKSQTIFRTEQGVSEMDQNARLLIDFLTRDVQQSKENALGLGPKFRSIYSYDGPDGKTDEITIVSSDTESKIPGFALPFTAARTNNFSALDHLVEIVPNGATGMDPFQVVNAIRPNEEMIISGVRGDGATQFDFVRITSAKVTPDGTIALSFEPVQPKGVQPEVPFGGNYENGNFTIRPAAIRRYYIDRTDKEHPTFALSVNDAQPMHIARNVVALQLRYLELKDGDIDGAWVKQQNISSQYKTQAIEVTMTARTEIKGEQQTERLVTLASVVRPRIVPGGGYGSAPVGGSPTFPGLPGDGGTTAGRGGPGGNGGAGGFPGGGLGGNGGSQGGGYGYGDDSTGLGTGGYNHETRHIGKQPKLGERLNPDQ